MQFNDKILFPSTFFSQTVICIHRYKICLQNCSDGKIVESVLDKYDGDIRFKSIWIFNNIL